jgi:hypothetical protein
MSRMFIYFISLMLILGVTSNKGLLFGEDNTRLHFTPQDFLDLMVGFNNGLQIFTNLQDFKACNANDNAIIQVVEDIIQIIKDIDFHSASWADIWGVITKIGEKVAVIVNKVLEVKDSCLRVAEQDFPQIGREMKNYFTADDFLKNLGIHSFTELNTIKNKIVATVRAFQANQWGNAGQLLGDVIHFAVFFDFKP